MSTERLYSLAYLTAHTCTPAQAVVLAASTGYQSVGLRLWPNAPGAPQQHLIGQPLALRETQAALQDTGVTVFDLEIVRLGEAFNAQQYAAFFEVGAALGARAVLVAADDKEPNRLVDHYAQLCEYLKPFGMTADLEFMPWTAVKNARQALQLVELAGSPSNAGILVDTLHFGRSDTSLADIRALPLQVLHYAQICDAPLNKAGDPPYTHEALIHTAREARLQPLEGDIDLTGLFQALPSSLPVSVEVIHTERMAQQSAKAWAQQCLDAAKKALEDR